MQSISQEQLKIIANELQSLYTIENLSQESLAWFDFWSGKVCSTNGLNLIDTCLPPPPTSYETVCIPLKEDTTVPGRTAGSPLRALSMVS